jgi:hypothetical protein
VEEFGIIGLSEDELRHINRGWHRLRPWPDSVRGLTRLKQHFIIAPLSNGNVSLLLNMAKHAGLPWDMIFGSDLFHHFKRWTVWRDFPQGHGHPFTGKLMNLTAAGFEDALAIACTQACVLQRVASRSRRCQSSGAAPRNRQAQ